MPLFYITPPFSGPVSKSAEVSQAGGSAVLPVEWKGMTFPHCHKYALLFSASKSSHGFHNQNSGGKGSLYPVACVLFFFLGERGISLDASSWHWFITGMKFTLNLTPHLVLWLLIRKTGDELWSELDHWREERGGETPLLFAIAERKYVMESSSY